MPDEGNSTNPFVFHPAGDTALSVPRRRPLGVWFVVAILVLDMIQRISVLMMWSRLFQAESFQDLSVYAILGGGVAISFIAAMAAVVGLPRGKPYGWWAAVFHAYRQLYETLWPWVFEWLLAAPTGRPDYGAHRFARMLAYSTVYGLMVLYLNRSHVVHFGNVHLTSRIRANLMVLGSCVLVGIGLSIVSIVLMVVMRSS